MFVVNKDDEYIVTIEDIVDKGFGVGKHEGFVIFIKDAFIGDVVKTKIIKVKKGYAYGRLEEIIEPSKDRVEPRCGLAAKCGGCQILPMSYEAQTGFKQHKVEELFKRAGLERGVTFNPIIGMEDPFFYRNKAQFPVTKNKDGNLKIGFYAGRTHDIVDIEKCYIQAEVNEEIMRIIKKFLLSNKTSIYNEETHSGLVRHILTRVGFKTGEIMVCIVINGKELPNVLKLSEELRKVEGMTSICLNVNKEKGNVILGKKIMPVWGQKYITDYIGDVKYQISPLSFYQVNPRQTEVLYGKVLDFAGLTGEEVVWDVYCGIGTISLFLAKNAKMVYGVEMVPEAIEDARINAGLNEIKNVEFFVGKAEEVLVEKLELEKIYADVIVVDPPRKGCEESVLATIAEMGPKKVIYVSCDPATLVRDLRIMKNKGYEVKEVQTVDMFPGTVHVETVVALHRKDM